MGSEMCIRDRDEPGRSRARDLPGSSQDYRLAAQIKQSSGGVYTLGSNLQAGFESRPSTNIELGCQFYPERQPLPFKLSLASSRVSQGDIELLVSSLVTNDIAASASSNSALATRAAETKTQRPPWSDFDGEVSVKLDELALESGQVLTCLLYTSPSPRDATLSRMPSSA